MTAMEAALSRGWEVVAPLPFGLDISIAVNCRDVTAADARALIDGQVPPSPGVAAQAEAMRRLAARVQLFQLAEQDSLVARRFLATMAAPDDRDSATAYAIIASERAAVAARVMIEQSICDRGLGRSEARRSAGRAIRSRTRSIMACP